MIPESWHARANSAFSDKKLRGDVSGVSHDEQLARPRLHQQTRGDP